MNIKKLIAATALIAGSLSFSTAAQASDGFQVVVNLALGSSISCSACHNGATNSATATLPMALTYRGSSTATNIANSDSDSDGFTNKQEASGSTTNFNVTAVTPFTVAAAAVSSPSTKVVVTGVIASETAIATDPYAETGVTLATGTTVAGAVSPLVTMDSATLFFPQPIVTGSKVYIVDLVAKTGTLQAGVVFNSNGSVTVTGAGTNVNLLVARAATAYTTGTAAAGGDNDDDDDGDRTAGGCITGASTLPLMMFMGLLSLGFIGRRKKD
jgi:hypothetical protein